MSFAFTDRSTLKPRLARTVCSAGSFFWFDEPGHWVIRGTGHKTHRDNANVLYGDAVARRGSSSSSKRRLSTLTQQPLRFAQQKFEVHERFVADVLPKNKAFSVH